MPTLHPFLFEAWKEYVAVITALPRPTSKEFTEEHYLKTLMAFDSFLEKERWFKQAQTQQEVSNIRKDLKASAPFKVGRYAITICPQSGDYNTLLQIMGLVTQITALPAGTYVIEQRSEGDEEPYGWHVHATYDSTYAPSKVKQFIYQKLKPHGWHRDNCRLYIKKCYNNAWEENYIRGNKFDASKDRKVLKDKELRLKYNLQDIYTW